MNDDIPLEVMVDLWRAKWGTNEVTVAELISAQQPWCAFCNELISVNRLVRYQIPGLLAHAYKLKE